MFVEWELHFSWTRVEYLFSILQLCQDCYFVNVKWHDLEPDSGRSLSLRRHTQGLLTEHLMHIAHTIGKTLGVSKSPLTSHLKYHLETKMKWCQTPSWKKKAFVFPTVPMSAYQDHLNAGFSKICETFQVCSIESLKYVQEFCTSSLLSRHRT